MNGSYTPRIEVVELVPMLKSMFSSPNVPVKAVVASEGSTSPSTEQQGPAAVPPATAAPTSPQSVPATAFPAMMLDPQIIRHIYRNVVSSPLKPELLRLSKPR